jgi:hypothetical protein
VFFDFCAHKSLFDLPGALILACPARFEVATYALEALKMRLNKPKNNDIEVLISAEARPLND